MERLRLHRGQAKRGPGALTGRRGRFSWSRGPCIIEQMRLRALRLSLIAPLAVAGPFFLQGCAEDPVEDPGLETIDLRGNLLEFPNGSPIAGAEICPTEYLEFEEIDCVTTDESGRFRVAYPANARDSYLTATVAGRPKHLIHVQPVGGLPLYINILTEADVVELTEATGSTYDPTKGTLVFFVNNGETALNGVSSTISPAGSVSPAMYYDGNWTPDPLLNATQIGAWGFASAAPGLYRVYTQYPDRDCEIPVRGREEDGGTPFLVEAGAVSVSSPYECTLPPSGSDETTG